jgi:hypothetical protein
MYDPATTGIWRQGCAARIRVEPTRCCAVQRRIVFVPIRMRLSGALLSRYLKPHRATLIDVELLRLPARETFSMYAT